MATKIVRTAIAGGAAAALCLAAPAPAGATRGQADPPGNNGTVKIDGVAFDDHPNNEPHVGCVFQVDFYGFDQGDLDATVTFTLVPPTADDDIVVDDVPIGEDAAGGGTDLDASATYDLSAALDGVEPHDQQGFHVRLTVHAEGSRGADTKFKEFWIDGCATTPGSTTTTTKPGHGGSTTTTSTPGETTTTKPDHGGSTTTTKPGEGGGTSSTSEQPTNPPGGPTTAPTGGQGGSGNGAAGQLPHTGSNAAPLAAAGLTLLGLGTAAGLTARRLRHTRPGL
jgi:LPXTG-motif cell wall-anchored protein